MKPYQPIPGLNPEHDEAVQKLAVNGFFGPGAQSLAKRSAASSAPALVPIGRTTDEFDGVIVGHWVCTSETRRSRRDRCQVRAVTSKCGVLAFYPDWVVRAGKLPASCWACRGGRQPATSPPPGCRTLSEQDCHILKSLWNAPIMGHVNPAIEYKTNLKGRDAVRDWGEFGVRFLERLICATPFGGTFGWKGYVRDCHYLPDKKGTDTARVTRVDEGNRMLTLTVHPKDSCYTFDVDMRTVRTDVPFRDVVRAVTESADPSKAPVTPATLANGTKPAAPKAPVATVATPSGPAGPSGPSGPIDVKQLLDLRNNMDALLAVGGDLNEIEKMKAEAQKKVDALRVRVGDAYRVRVERENESEKAGVTASALRDKVDELDRKLRNTIVDRDAAEKSVIVADEHMATATETHEILDAQLKAAENELAEADKLAQERLATLGRAKDLLPLLQALKAMGG